MTDFIRLLLFPLNSPSKKSDKKDSIIKGFELKITQIFLHETPLELVMKHNFHGIIKSINGPIIANKKKVFLKNIIKEMLKTL